MANRQKIKGKAFERDVAKHLTETFGWNWERVPGSGAFVGGKNAFRKKQLTENQLQLSDGDLIPPEQLSNVKVECKSYKDFSFNGILTGKNSLLDEWIKQAIDDRKIWFLIFKINNKGSYVVFDINCKYEYSNKCCAIYKNDYKIVSYDGFFEANRENIIQRHSSITSS